MPSLRFLALALVTCSSAALAIACGGDDVAAVPDAAGGDATSQDTGTNDTGTNDTGTNDTGTGTDGGTDGSTTPTGIVCSPNNCTLLQQVCCAPNGGSTDTCNAIPDGGFGRICAANESEFHCSTTDSCGGGNSRCCARWPKTPGDGGPVYTATCQIQGCAPSGLSFAVTLCTPNGKYGCGDGGNTCKPLVQVDGGAPVPPGYYACQP